MLIDWFTVGAQVLNFLILVWLMKRFLYQPILRAIAAREEGIAAELAEAAAQKTAAQQERAQFQHKNEQFDGERAALWTKATDEAKIERQRLFDEARKAADGLSAQRQEALSHAALTLNRTIGRRAQDEVFSIARKALADLASTSLEARFAEVFVQRLHALDESSRAALGLALKGAAEPALVRSAFDLPAESRATIGRALNETFSADIPLRFETTPDLVGGIELIANGQKVAWSIADYLTSLATGVSELLHAKVGPQPGASAAPAKSA